VPNFMKDISFKENQITILTKLISFNSVEIIWDINAFYINTNNLTFKLECLVDYPLGSNYEYDEISYCDLYQLDEIIKFDDDNSIYWYKILSKNCKINNISYINILQEFPSDELVDLNKIEKSVVGLNKITIGIILQTNLGFIPAFLLPSNYGFQWQPKFDFYNENEINKLIRENIKYYEIKNCS